MSTRVTHPSEGEVEFCVPTPAVRVCSMTGACSSASVEPCISTRVVELFISIPLGFFSYAKRFPLQMANFVTSRGPSCEGMVNRSHTKQRNPTKTMQPHFRPSQTTSFAA
jgi:hypothetical protein